MYSDRVFKKKEIVRIYCAYGDELKISFRRTIRVPDGKSDSELPPDLGIFPLYSVADYKKMLPINMASKGGAFFPMYRK